MNENWKVEQLGRMRFGKGFIAALDQSGGSTPKALKLYGIDESLISSTRCEPELSPARSSLASGFSGSFFLK